jgi:3-mercaptopropionate dioxygenase
VPTPAGLAELVAALTAAVDAADGPHAAVDAVTTVLRARVADPALLDDVPLDPGPDGSREHVLHVDPAGRFSLLVLVWRPGETTPPHDHVTWGVVGVHRGVEVETRYGWDDERLVVTAVARSIPGGVDGFVPPGDVHVVRAEGDDVVVSVHVYGTDVTRRGTSVKRVYAVPAG